MQQNVRIVARPPLHVDFLHSRGSFGKTSSSFTICETLGPGPLLVVCTFLLLTSINSRFLMPRPR
ncbi:unnamed protein product [Schistosoma margrebowiei]|uniref:Uncharacterized protein n=1 Tax=Schistosoma margrebowiei TaxID=48269 RepID=A0A183MNB6_9TREM|nr:unnamed protein product [Schistosoma margrebowiei]